MTQMPDTRLLTCGLRDRPRPYCPETDARLCRPRRAGGLALLPLIALACGLLWLPVF